MALSHFFGEKSLFDLIVATIAILTGSYTLYKNFIERAKLKAFPADKLELVISIGGGCRKMHLRVNLVNHGAKTGTLHRLEAEIANPQGKRHRFHWILFFEYLPGAVGVRPNCAPYPLSIAAKNSELLMAEFETDVKPPPSWPQGRYSVELIGWVNRRDRRQRPNLKQTFHFDLTQGLSEQLTEHRPTEQAEFIEVPILEWSG